MNEDAILNYSIKKAKELAQQEGLEIGRVVVHESDDLAYLLKEIRDDIAVVWQKKEGTEKEFPLNEIFDPNDAKRFAVEKTIEQGMKDKEKYESN